MKHILFLLLPLLVLFSCSSSSTFPKPQRKSEISEFKLKANDIVAINSRYKQSYYKLLPYLYLNSNDTFKGIRGDFYNVKFNINSDFNIKVGFYSKYGSHTNSLLVLIALSQSSTIPIKNIPISVVSSKHGIFKLGNLPANLSNRPQQRKLFVKNLELEIENRFDVLNKIKDDVISVNVGGQIYTFLNPELELE